MKNTTKLFVLAALLTVGCKTVETATGEKVKAFRGTIVYDVEVEQKSDTSFEKDKKALYGNEMHLTVFKNGDVQRTYDGTGSQGYEIYFLDVDKNQIVEKYKNSDTLYVHRASVQNIQKVSDLRSKNEAVSILNYNLKEVSVTAQEAPNSTRVGRYLSLKYWYTPELKVDKNKYASINDDLWGYFMNKSDGSIYLKYEINYFTYKVTYTAREILPGTFEKVKEKLSEEVPRVKN
ncbi:MAG: hypothetical protein QMC70_10695 [Bacteroidia bacterium]|jgi:hypothetical protein|tara:strand:+ start:598 stop:1299 length:702 start_codon:yes stop_codon:yes gene_type:complete